jgi:hypothetical protein
MLLALGGVALAQTIGGNPIGPGSSVPIGPGASGTAAPPPPTGCGAGALDLSAGCPLVMLGL